MPYVKRTTRAGKTIEVECYFTSRYNKRGGSRKDKVKATREEQKKVNTRVAERKLRLLMNNNFGYGDYHIVLDYIRKRGQPDRTKEEMKKDIAVFLRELRKQYRLRGKELKYIHVMEIGEKGARHHHLVINQIDTQILQEAWFKAYANKDSRVKVFPLDKTGQYKKLASYFIKYTDKTMKTDKALQGKRWNCSKNLIRPKSKYQIMSNRSWFRIDPKPKKGYYIDLESVERGITSPEYYGYGWFRYTMVKLD